MDAIILARDPIALTARVFGLTPVHRWLNLLASSEALGSVHVVPPTGSGPVPSSDAPTGPCFDEAGTSHPEEGDRVLVVDGNVVVEHQILAVALRQEAPTALYVDEQRDRAGLVYAGISVWPRQALRETAQNVGWTDGEDLIRASGLRFRRLRVPLEPDTFWYRIRSPSDAAECAALLAQHLRKPRDGPVARLLNRRLSIPLSIWLSTRTRVTADQMSFLSFGTAVLAGALLAWGNRLGMAAGGLLSQIASVLDGCDGELARLRGTASPRGGWLDAVLDRWADAFVMSGLAAAGWQLSGSPWAWWLEIAALAGALTVSYSETRYQEAFGRPIPPRGHLPAKRDVRLFLAMLGGLAGCPLVTLALIAGLCAAEVGRRLWTYGCRRAGHASERSRLVR